MYLSSHWGLSNESWQSSMKLTQIYIMTRNILMKSLDFFGQTTLCDEPTNKLASAHRGAVWEGLVISLLLACWTNTVPWWRHQMEVFSASLARCAGNSPVTGEFHTQRPVTRSFDVFFDIRLIKRLSIQTTVRLVIWDAIALIMTSL